MTLQRLRVLVFLILGVHGNVSTEEAELGAATSSAVYGSDLTDIEYQLQGTKLVNGPYPCVGDLTCVSTVHSRLGSI